MDSLPPSSGSDDGGATVQAAVHSNGTEINRLEVNKLSSDEGNESGDGALNPSRKAGINEDGAGLPKVPVFKEPKAMRPPSSMPPPSRPHSSMPPLSMPPPKITKSNLPGPMGPPQMRAKQSKEEVKEPVQSSAAEGMLLSRV